MTRDLKDELAIPTFMQECGRRGTFQGETAKHERSSGESKVLPFGIAILADRLKGFRPPQRTFGNHQLGEIGFKNLAGSLKTTRTGLATIESGPHLPLPKASEHKQTYSGGLDLCDVIVPTVPSIRPDRT
jgi:hypothetical protein